MRSSNLIIANPDNLSPQNVDSTDHKSHVAFPSGGPDSGTCSDPNFPITLPRIFLEVRSVHNFAQSMMLIDLTQVYWTTQIFDAARKSAMNASQPFV